MIIRVDCREKKLLKCMEKYQSEDVKVEKKPLELGDIIICDDQNNECVIIERKTLRDLGSSILDGRYVEQSFRLKECSCQKIYYFIEGDIENFKEGHGVTKKMLRSAIFSLSYFKGFSALRTKNVGETAEFIFSACKKIMNDKGEKVPKNYADVVKRTKKSNITKDNIGEIMLSQIPKISSATAKVLMNKYKTFPELIAAISNNRESLNDLKIVNKKGKSRKVNKTAIQNLIKFLS